MPVHVTLLLPYVGIAVLKDTPSVPLKDMARWHWTQKRWVLGGWRHSGQKVFLRSGGGWGELLLI